MPDRGRSKANSGNRRLSSASSSRWRAAFLFAGSTSCRRGQARDRNWSVASLAARSQRWWSGRGAVGVPQPPTERCTLECAIVHAMEETASGQAEHVAAEVRRRRQQRGWTLDTAASRLGVSRRLLAQLEAGQANPSLSTLLSIAAGFDISLVDLLAGEDKPSITLQADNASAPVLWTGAHGGEARLLVGSDPLELWHWSLAPGDERASDAHRSNAREALLVIAGAVTLRVGLGRPGRGEAGAVRTVPFRRAPHLSQRRQVPGHVRARRARAQRRRAMSNHRARLDQPFECRSGDLRTLARLSADPRRRRSRRYGCSSTPSRRAPQEAHESARSSGSGESDAHTVRWHAAYRDFGIKPRVARPSVDALVRRAASDNGLPRINALVDLYNAISILHRVPIGGEDLDRYVGPARLTLATGTEPFNTTADGVAVVDHAGPR